METITMLAQIVGAVVNLILFVMLVNAVLSITKIAKTLEDMGGRQQFFLQKILKAIEGLGA